MSTRIGLISDPHATAAPVAEALSLFKAAEVDSIFCAGDIAGYGNELEATLDEAPKQSEPRYQLAARQLVDGDYDNALENFMLLLKRDRNYGDGAAQRGLLTVFALLDEDDERIPRYRRQMFALLH